MRLAIRKTALILSEFSVTGNQIAIFTGLVALFIYLLSIYPDITWDNYGGDGGELISAAYTLGIPHPPGYPTYVILGKLFSYLPFGTIAFRFNLFSAGAMAVAVTFLTSASIQFGDRKQTKINLIEFTPFIVTGLLFALTPLVWSQAVIAEVYALNLAVVALLFWYLMSGRAVKHPLITGIILGLSITTHLSSLFVMPLTLLLIPWRTWPRLFLGTLLGLSPFTLLVVMATPENPMIWSEPDSLAGWWWLVSAKVYQPNIFSVPFNQWVDRLRTWDYLSFALLILLGFYFVVADFFRFTKKKRIVLLSIILTALFYFIYSLGYRSLDSMVLLIPGLMLLIFLIGLGIAKARLWSICLLLFLIALNLFPKQGSDSGSIRIPMEELMNRLPENSLIITQGDQTISALWYFQLVEGKRIDTIIVDGNLFQFDGYRKRIDAMYPELIHLEKDDLSGFIHQNSTQRPVCEVSLVMPRYLRCTNPDNGLFEETI